MRASQGLEQIVSESENPVREGVQYRDFRARFLGSPTPITAHTRLSLRLRPLPIKLCSHRPLHFQQFAALHYPPENGQGLRWFGGPVLASPPRRPCPFRQCRVWSVPFDAPTLRTARRTLLSQSSRRPDRAHRSSCARRQHGGWPLRVAPPWEREDPTPATSLQAARVFSSTGHGASRRIVGMVPEHSGVCVVFKHLRFEPPRPHEVTVARRSRRPAAQHATTCRAL